MPPKKNNKKKTLNENNIVSREEELNEEIDNILADSKQEQLNKSISLNENEDNNELLIGLNQEENNELDQANEPIINIDNGNDDHNNNDNADKKAQEAKELENANESIDESVKITMFMDKLNTYNSMFKTNIDANKFVYSVTSAWALLQSNERDVRTDGWATLGNVFRDTLKEAFAVERALSYKEHRLPDYAEIIRSTNYLLRVAMFNFTDLYSNKEKAYLFKSTAFGGLTAKDMAKLITWKESELTDLDDEKIISNEDEKTENKEFKLDDTEKIINNEKHSIISDNKLDEEGGNLLFDPEITKDAEKKDLVNNHKKVKDEAEKKAEKTEKDLWSMDQKSDEAWEIQSAEAKDIAAEWQKAEQPYEKLINEMNALAERGKNSIAEVDHREIYNKLAAAEWMLINNDEMMIESSENPGEKIPNWGNKYWKAIIQTREALGIPKHTSIRELIQGDYAESSKAANDMNFNERQIEDHVLDAEVRGMFDSMESQRSEFTIQSEDIKLYHPVDDLSADFDPNAIRYRYPVNEENELIKHRNSKKENNFIIDKDTHKDINLDVV